MYKRTTPILLGLLLCGVLMMSAPVAASSQGVCERDANSQSDITPEFDDKKNNYCQSVDDVEQTRQDLEDMIVDIEEGDQEYDDANETLHQLKEEYQIMKSNEESLRREVINATEDGSLVGGFGVLRTIDNDANQIGNELDDTLSNYEQTVGGEYSSIKNTIRGLFGGSLGVGLIIGAIAGGAIPYIAERRAQNAMTFTEDVSFGKKIVIAPSVIGGILAIGGLVVVTVLIGWGNLIQVIT